MGHCLWLYRTLGPHLRLLSRYIVFTWSFSRFEFQYLTTVQLIVYQPDPWISSRNRTWPYLPHRFLFNWAPVNELVAKNSFVQRSRNLGVTITMTTILLWELEFWWIRKSFMNIEDWQMQEMTNERFLQIRLTSTFLFYRNIWKSQLFKCPDM